MKPTVEFSHLTSIAAALNSIEGIVASATLSDLRDADWNGNTQVAILTINGKVFTGYRFDEKRESYGFRRNGTGEFYIRVDGYGWRSRGGYSQPAKVYPIRKDGTLNVQAIAEHIAGVLAHEARQADKRSTADKNRELSDLLQKEIGYDIGYLSPSQYTEGRVAVKIDKELTADQIRAIAKIVKGE